ncbi:MAG: hypothetical protein ABEJ82_04575 [Haloplanus sp.]
MSSESAPARQQRDLLELPSHPVAYVALLASLVSAGVHLFLAPRVMGFSQTTGTLFYLNGFGYIGGILLYLSRYWRRELYLVAALYGLTTIVAFFALSGRINWMSIVSKTAEAVLVVTTAYLYTSETS